RLDPRLQVVRFQIIVKQSRAVEMKMVPGQPLENLLTIVILTRVDRRVENSGRRLVGAPAQEGCRRGQSYVAIGMIEVLFERGNHPDRQRYEVPSAKGRSVPECQQILGREPPLAGDTGRKQLDYLLDGRLSLGKVRKLV